MEDRKEEYYSEQMNLFDEKGIGKRIRNIRRERGLSLDDLANKAYLSRSYLSQIERGERSMTLDYVRRIAAGLEMSPDELFFYDNESYESYKDYTFEGQNVKTCNFSSDQLGKRDLFLQNGTGYTISRHGKMNPFVRKKKMQDINAIIMSSADCELNLIYNFLTQLLGLKQEEETE